MPDRFTYTPTRNLWPIRDPSLIRAKLRALYFATAPLALRADFPEIVPLETVYLIDDTLASTNWAFNFQGEPGSPQSKDATKDNTYWMDTDTENTAYNYLELNSPWVLYISNGEMIFHNIAPGGTSTTVPSGVTFVWNTSTNEPDYTPPTN